MTPTEPDAGEVALTETLCFCGDVHDCQTTEDSERLKAACDANVQRVSALLDRERREVGERIARAIEADAIMRDDNSQWRDGMEDAARIAREATP